MNRKTPPKLKTTKLLYKSLIRPIMFIRNTQVHKETNTRTIKDFITTMTLNFHSRLPLPTGVLFYHIGRTSLNTRLKPHLLLDVLNL